MAEVFASIAATRVKAVPTMPDRHSSVFCAAELSSLGLLRTDSRTVIVVVCTSICWQSSG